MSHQRYASHDPVKEPHSISLKVLRLSRPSLVAQHPLPHKATPTTTTTTTPRQPPIPASLAYTTTHDTNPTPFLLSPILNLPPSFGSAYNHHNHHHPPPSPPPVDDAPHTLPPPAAAAAAPPPPQRKYIRDVRIEAEMKTPASQSVTKLPLSPAPAPGADGVDLDPGRTLQRIVNFDLKEEGNHVLGVTVSYYEATDTSGRTRTFRKLYQFVCKPSLIVRTKASPLAATTTTPQEGAVAGGEKGGRRRRWVLEAQLENCSEDTTELERVVLELEPGLSYRDCNWEASGSPKPVLHPGEVEQVCFVIEETEGGGVEEQDGKIMFGVMCIAWRSEMGQKGYLATNKLGTRHV
ncbi:Trafficking protein particle complex subunit 13 [Cytospora mali]|uniref:Trafficking protein particle complex subunit 13 n=1 Tax=Cytospora mali TaxID=578113 RepID=A0A194VSG1_CYTMA|nr:Trafficking protein particle complex subunit 13 [Valsa mali]